jgi:putative hydrolase of the HAD superfamily
VASVVILFDIDDTLLAHSHAIDVATRALYARVDPTLSPQEFVAAWTSAHRRYFGLYLAGGISYEEQRRARAREVIDATLADREADDLFAGYFDEYVAAWSLFPDVLPCLDRLSRFRLGVISNGQSHQQRLKLERMGIAERFERVLISEDCGHWKPAPEIFLRACSLLGVQPADAVYVGDLYDVDAVGARKAGLTGVWLDRAGDASTEHAPPVVGSLDDLPAVIAIAGRSRGEA